MLTKIWKFARNTIYLAFFLLVVWSLWGYWYKNVYSANAASAVSDALAAMLGEYSQYLSLSLSESTARGIIEAFDENNYDAITGQVNAASLLLFTYRGVNRERYRNYFAFEVYSRLPERDRRVVDANLVMHGLRSDYRVFSPLIGDASSNYQNYLIIAIYSCNIAVVEQLVEQYGGDNGISFRDRATAYQVSAMYCHNLAREIQRGEVKWARMGAYDWLAYLWLKINKRINEVINGVRLDR